MGAVVHFPRRAAPRPVETAENPIFRELRLTLQEIREAYPSTAERAWTFFHQSQTGPSKMSNSALGAAFAELVSIPPNDGEYSPKARYAAQLLIAIAFPTTQPGVA